MNKSTAYVGDVIYLDKKYPKKDWPVSYVAQNIRDLLIKGKPDESKAMLDSLPEQFVIGQLHLEITKLVHEHFNTEEED